MVFAYFRLFFPFCLFYVSLQHLKVIMDPGYKKTITPVPDDGAGNLPVSFSLSILDILQVDEMKEIFTAKISIRREWMDRRLTYKNLKKENSNKNDLSNEEADSIWYPSVFINNIEDSEKVKPTDIEKHARVIPDQNVSFTFKNNRHFFKGSENKLTLTKQWTVEFVCHYSLHWYPFDTQVIFVFICHPCKTTKSQACRMEFVKGTDFTELQPIELDFNREISLGRYSINSIQMCNSLVGNAEGIVVEISLGRPIVSNILTVFIPTITLMSVSFMSRVFVEDYVDMVVEVNLTIFLVLATL